MNLLARYSFVLLLLTCFQINSAEAQGLVAYYPFNGNANDESGNGNDGIENGGVALTNDRFGNPSSAYQFDGIDDYIEIPDNGFSKGSSFSISIWIYIIGDNPSINSNNIILNKEVSSNNTEFRIEFPQPQSDRIVFEGNSLDVNPSITLYNIADSIWYHFVLIYDANQLFVFQNGIPKDTVSNNNGSIEGDQPIYIGTGTYNNSLLDYYFNGIIDDIRIYNKALTQSDILNIYSEGGWPRPIASYPFNGNVNDESGNGYNATLGDGTTSSTFPTLTSDRFGKANSAYSFDGIDDYLQTLPSSTIPSSITISAWIKPSATGSQLWGSIEDPSGGKDGFVTSFSSTDVSATYYKNNLEEGPVISSSNPIVLGEWIHLVETIDASQNLSLYANGNKLVSGTLGSVPDSHDRALMFGIGIRLQSQYSFEGAIDDIKIYDKALSDSEVQTLYQSEVGPIAYYPFNGNVNDESGNGYNATLGDGTTSATFPTLTSDRFGNANSAYYFDGIDDYLQTLPVSSIPSYITISAWIKPVTLGSQLWGSVEDPSGGKDGLVTSYSSTNITANYYKGNIEEGPVSTSSNPISIGEWVHLVETIDGNQNLSLYVNGVKMASGALNTVPDSHDRALMFGIGIRLQSQYFYEGTIDDIRIYGRSLSDSEIQNLYQSQSGPIAYYPFNGNANDESGNGNNGTLGDGSTSSTYPTLTSDRFGNTNSAYNFDGVNDYLEYGQTNQYLTQNELSASGWFKMDTLSHMVIFSNYNGGTFVDGDFHFDYWNNQRIQVAFGQGSNLGVFYITDSINLADNAWHFVAFSYDESRGDGNKIRIWIDSLEVTSTPSSGLHGTGEGTGGIILNTTVDLRTGANFYTEYFKGSIDDIRLYNRALSTDEINKLYTEGGWPLPSNKTDILTFTIPGQTGSSLIDNTNHTIQITVPYGTDVTNLVTTFSLSPGATATVASNTQLSGTTANDFSNPVTYTVTAEDGTTTQNWLITVIIASDNQKPAFVNVSFPTEFPSSATQIKSYIQIIDNSPSILVSFNYKKPSESDFPATQSQNITIDSNGDYTINILRSWITDEGIEYYYLVDDGTFQVSTDTVFMALVYDNSSTSPSIPNLSSGGQAQNWRMFSIPFVLDDKSIASRFESELGTYDKSKWRILHYKNDIEKFVEYRNGLSTIERGKGYWFNSVQPVAIPMGPGKSPNVIKGNLSTITLNQGWSQIGNPYTFDVLWSDVLAFNNTTGVEGLRVFDGTSIVDGSTLKAYGGAYVFSSQGTTLQIPINGSSGGRTNYSVEPDEWLVNINSMSGLFSNTISGLGMADNADLSKDDYDRIRVPRFAKFVDITFNHPEFFAPNFAMDIVPTQENYEWEFEVETNTQAENVTLFWNKQGDLKGKLLVLYDQKENEVLDLSIPGSYIYPYQESKKFKAYYGDLQFISSKLNQGQLILGKNFPNPFHDKTIIPFSLMGSDQSYQVNLSVVDLFGKEVATLFNGSLPSGLHSIEWNQNSNGTFLKGGVYICVLKVRSINTNTILYSRMLKR